MDMIFLERELSRFPAERPIDEARTPPPTWYTDPAFFALERETVLRQNWQPVGRKNQLQKEGDYIAGRFGGVPYALVGGPKGEPRAMHNVCRHRATEILQGDGCVAEIACPYHGWTYNLEGCLKRAPELGGVKNFRTEDFGLGRLPLDTWGPFTFVHFGSDATPVARGLERLTEMLEETRWMDLKFFARRSYVMDCNWKVYVDNYLDGGYHVPYLHKDLSTQLDLKSYQIEVFDRYSVQTCGGKGAGGSTSGANPSARIGSNAIYAWIYPCFMINRYGPFMDTNWVVPLSQNKTEVIFDYYVTDDPATTAPEFLEKSLEASDKVQQEDVQICAQVQRGLESGVYRPGPYSVLRQTTEYHFHQLLASELRAAVKTRVQ